MRYVILTEREEVELTRVFNTSNSAAVRQRIHCLLLSSKKYPTTRLMELLGVARITIYNWFNDWEKRQYESLLPAIRTGRKRKLRDIPLEHLLRLGERNNLDMDKSIQEIEETYQIKCHRLTLVRFLRKHQSVLAD